MDFIVKESPIIIAVIKILITSIVALVNTMVISFYHNFIKVIIIVAFVDIN